jgi:hypothetical protein
MPSSSQELVATLMGLFPPDEDIAGQLSGGDRERMLRQELERLAAPEFVTEMVADAGFRTERRGIDGFIEAWDDWLEAFDSFRVELEDTAEFGETLVTLVVLRGVPTRGSAEIANSNAAVWFIKDKRLERVEFHMDRELAMRSAEAGLPGR